jgi:histone acetyltransferase (RNA polymerase elongator complex component)
MSEANCIQIDFGVERGSNEALQKVKKGITIEKVKEVFTLCRQYHIRTLANFLVGLPEEVQKDREDIELLISQIKPTVVAINNFTPYQGTAIYDGGYRTVDSDPALDRWVAHGNRRWNSIWRNLYFHLSWNYLKTILKSKRKGNYIKQLGTLIGEAINQKW